MREIVLDTETTGLDPQAGHRLIEIAAIELVNHLPTGKTFHRYVNPERDISPEAQAVHGISLAQLADKPLFAAIVADFLEFIGDSKLIIHNADFDMGFINAELAGLGFPALPRMRAVDTVQMARRKFPGAPASLDALCQRFSIDNTHRELHGALLDAELLGHVYLELIGGRQAAMSLEGAPAARQVEAVAIQTPAATRPGRAPTIIAPSESEQAAHAALLAKIKNPIWAA